jgi:hypothetical protein
MMHENGARIGSASRAAGGGAGGRFAVDGRAGGGVIHGGGVLHAGGVRVVGQACIAAGVREKRR